MAIIGNGAGIIPWAESYAKYFKRDYTPKSFSINLPVEIMTASTSQKENYWNTHPGTFDKYWDGLIGRKGNNPLVYLNVENGGFNSMSFPNPGVKATLDEIISSKCDTPIRLSIFGQDESELKRIVQISKNHKAYSLVKSFEINVSCPNTKCGERASSNDINRIASYIRAVKDETDKYVIIKLSPLVDASEFIEAIIKAGADGVSISNTIPGRAFNKFTGELLMPVGGVDGPIIYDRMLKNVSDTYQKMKEINQFIPIYASGGITTQEKALETIKAGATFIDLGYIFKDVDGEEIGKTVESFENYLSGFDLGSLRGTMLIKSNPLFWNDSSRWHVNPDGSRQLKVYSEDHQQLIVSDVVRECADTSTIYFTEDIPHFPGQYVGAMLKLGDHFEERPFTLSGKNCITVRDVGPVSHALNSIKKSDKLYVRGPLGNGLHINSLGKTLVIGGGCGAAAIAEIPEQLQNCYAVLAFKKAAELMLEERLSKHCNVSVHVDEEYGGVLPVKNINFGCYDNIVLCGPRPMMIAAAKEAVNQGLNPEKIYLIMESIFKCFNGLCSACDCGGLKLCKSGPVVTYAKLQELTNLTFRGKEGMITSKVSIK